MVNCDALIQLPKISFYQAMTDYNTNAYKDALLSMPNLAVEIDRMIEKDGWILDSVRQRFFRGYKKIDVKFKQDYPENKLFNLLHDPFNCWKWNGFAINDNIVYLSLTITKKIST